MTREKFDASDLPPAERDAVVRAIREMSQRPSSQPRAARLIGFTQQHINKVINTGRGIGVDTRDAVIAWLAEHAVIRDTTVEAFLERYGSSALRESWTWDKLLATQDRWQTRQIAKKQARREGVPVEAAARVCTKPPWVSLEFGRREVAWWTEEMKRVAREDAERAAITPDDVAKLANEEFETLVRAG